jgi:hypothetical protein
MKPSHQGKTGLVELSLGRSRAALKEGFGSTAMEWLNQVPEGLRPIGLEAEINYQMSKEAASRGEWDVFEKLLTSANRQTPTPVYQKRLELVRRRKPLIDDPKWETLDRSIDLATRLSTDSFSPLLSGIWTCGAYYSRGPSSAGPWSQFLRQAKNPSADPVERQAVLGIATGFFCRLLLERTPLLSNIDAVAAIPANPARYSERRMSLPDFELLIAQQMVPEIR